MQTCLTMLSIAGSGMTEIEFTSACQSSCSDMYVSCVIEERGEEVAASLMWAFTDLVRAKFQVVKKVPKGTSVIKLNGFWMRMVKVVGKEMNTMI